MELVDTFKKYSSLCFVDRVNYQNLINSSFTQEDIVKMHYEVSAYNDKVSLLSKASLINLNKELNKLIYFSQLSDKFYDSLVLLSKQEKQYIEDSFKSTYLTDIKNDPYYNDKKYYEIVVLPDGTLLTVVEEGFLAFVTESKDNLLKFILDCLCYQYKFDFMSFLMKTYISLKLNDTYFNLIKSRFN